MPGIISTIPKWCNVVVIDSGSSDDTVSWLEGFISSCDRYMKLITREGNPGKRAVAEYASGLEDDSYVLEVDDDVIVPEGFVDRMVVLALSMGDNIGFVGHDMYWKGKTFCHRWVDAIQHLPGPTSAKRIDCCGDVGVILTHDHYEYYGHDLFVNGACRLSKAGLWKSFAPKSYGNDIPLNRIVLGELGLDVGFVLGTDGKCVKHCGGTRKK